MPRPLPNHLIPNIKEVNDVDTTQGESLHGLRNGSPGPDDGTESTPVADNASRGTVAPSRPHIVVTSQRSSEHGKIAGSVCIHDYRYYGDLHKLRKLVCAALETLDAAVEDHHRTKTWDEPRTVAYGDPITMQFVANTDYIGGNGT